MSSLKRASKIGQRTHRERSQPESRAHLGNLEKKKDYKQRADDYNRKKRKLQKLRRRALDRNPDEFHFHMVRSRIKDDGVHQDLKQEPDEDSLLQKKLSEIKDLNYIKYRLNLENKKIEKLKSELHFADVAAVSNSHTIFVDTEKEAKHFEPALYFNTSTNLLGRAFNRPRSSTLACKSFFNATSKENVKEVDRTRRVKYKELLKRIERAKELRIVVAKLETKKNIALSRGGELQPIKISNGEVNKAPLYKWTYERKK